jgi:hypothetical protein
MARKVNWAIMEKSTKDLKKKIKNVVAAGEYLKDKPEPGYFKDNMSKKIIKIEDAKSSTLRRVIKLVDKFYYLITAQEDRDWLLNKKIELETVLNSRDDGTIEKEEDL